MANKYAGTKCQDSSVSEMISRSIAINFDFHADLNTYTYLLALKKIKTTIS